MSKDPCDYFGRPVTPCANCGGTEGHMVRANNHSDMWIHAQPVDCIVQLQSALKAAHATIAALQAAQQEPPQ